MSATYHTPLPPLWTPTSSDWNSRLGELDAAIYSVLDGDLDWLVRATAPGIPPRGTARLYINDSDQLCLMDDDGTVTEIEVRNPEAYIAFYRDASATAGSSDSEGLFPTGSWETRQLRSDYSNLDGIGSCCQMDFANGGEAAIAVGDVLTTEWGRSATVYELNWTSGSWEYGNAAGSLWLMQSNTGSMRDFVGGVGSIPAQANVCTLANKTFNQIRLAAGTYIVNVCSSATREVGVNQLRLRDVSNNVTLATGLNAYGDAVLMECPAFLVGYFTLTAPTTLELQHYSVGGSGAGVYSWYHGGGIALNISSQVEFWKTA